MSASRRVERQESEYLAWDGITYEGDPPEGWYLATDHRWWPSEDIINENFGYAEPYKKAYLDDDEAYGEEYPNLEPGDPLFQGSDPNQAEPERDRRLELPSPARVASEHSPRPQSQPSAASTPPSSSTLPPPTTAPLPDPRLPAAVPNQAQRPPTRARRPQSPRQQRGRPGLGRGISIIIFAAITLARCASGGDDGSSAPPDLPTLDLTQEEIEDLIGGNESIDLPEPQDPVDLSESLGGDPAPGLSIAGPTPCPAEDGSSDRVTSFAEAPPFCIDIDKQHFATIDTNVGFIEIELNTRKQPGAVNNFVVLSRYHYFDGIAFNYISPELWAEPDEPFTNTYQVAAGPVSTEPAGYGSVIMPQAERGSLGSHFMLVTSDDASSRLEPEFFPVLGTVAPESEALRELAAVETDTTATPIVPVLINSIVIEEVG